MAQNAGTAPPSRMLDLDELVNAIREEAAYRARSPLDIGLDTGASGSRSGQAGGTPSRREPFLRLSRATHVRDFLPLHGPDFVAAVFNQLLRREPEPDALEHYLRLIANGQRSRWEVIASVMLSPEGRRNGVRLRGAAGMILSVGLFRIPLFGWIWARTAEILRLPAHMRDLGDEDRKMIALINSLR